MKRETIIYPNLLMFRLRPMIGNAHQEASEEVIQMILQLGENAAGFYLDCLEHGWSFRGNDNDCRNCDVICKRTIHREVIFLHFFHPFFSIHMEPRAICCYITIIRKTPLKK